MSSSPAYQASLARSLGLRGTLLGFGAGRMAVVVEPYSPVNLGGATATYTLEFWMRADPDQSGSNGQDEVPLIVWSGEGEYPFAVTLDASTGELIFRRKHSGGTVELVVSPPDAESGYLDGNFHHVALVRSVAQARTGSDDWQMYYLQVFIDGESAPDWRAADGTTGTGSGDNPPEEAYAPSDAALVFGGNIVQVNNQPTTVAYTGELSQVRVWRGGMTEAQIEAVRYEALRGPISLWSMTPTAAAGRITLQASAATTVNPGFQVQAPDGTTYSCLERTELSESGAQAQLMFVCDTLGQTGNLPSGMTLEVVGSGLAISSAVTDDLMLNGTNGDGAQRAVGFVTLSNQSAHDTVTVPLGSVVGTSTFGVHFELLDDAELTHGNTQSVPVRALEAGEDGNVGAGEITWVSPSAVDSFTWSGTSPDHGVTVTNAATLEQGRNVSSVVASGQVTFSNGGDTLAVVQVGTVVAATEAGPYFQTTEQANLAPGDEVQVPITAIDVGSEYNEQTVAWISPLYLVPESVTISAATPTHGGLDPHRDCVGCWCMDEGFGRIVYNYAADMHQSPRGDGTFSAVFPTLVATMDAKQLQVELPTQEPIWKISTLMAPPAFIRGPGGGG
ncbi:MAG: baseplate J/gp47 family protein [Alphaproteobacteria bacterium]|nr:baseplate J/gp47 family protein [Alphaproteobacteria bacterium]